MSQENVEAFRRFVDAYNNRDVKAVLDELDAEVEWHPAMQASDGGASVYRGHEGVRAIFRDFSAAFAEMQIQYAEVRDLGDRVVAIGRVRFAGREGWGPSRQWGALAEYRDGKAIRIRTFLDHRAALEAAGLRE